MECGPLKITAEGRMTIEDARLHVGGVALSDILDNLPGRYIGPAKTDYGHARITLEVQSPVKAEATLALPEVAA